jgi:hypothetical protein
VDLEAGVLLRKRLVPDEEAGRARPAMHGEASGRTATLPSERSGQVRGDVSRDDIASAPIHTVMDGRPLCDLLDKERCATRVRIGQWQGQMANVEVQTSDSNMHLYERSSEPTT